MPEDAIKQTDGIRGLQQYIVIARSQLVGVNFAPVKDDPLDQSGKDRQLHFDIVDRAGLIDCFDIEDRKLIVLEVLKAVRVFDRHIDNRIRQFKNGVEQADQRQFVLR